MTVYFCNNGLVPLDAIRTMGVSIKDGDMPIGYFGTGLKFAIATLIRTGHNITLRQNGERHTFGTISKSIRGEDFNIVTMDSEQLAYTTQLGRNWQPWQAYRELHSNALDENGETIGVDPGEQYETVFEVSGEGIESAHRDRSTIFLDAPIVASTSRISIHQKYGSESYAYYRGVRAGKMDHLPLFHYNLIESDTLTEDRTLTSLWSLKYWAASAIAASSDVDLIEQALLAPDLTAEARFDYSNRSPSEAFMSVCERLRSNQYANKSAINLWRTLTRKNDFEGADTTASEEAEISRALALLPALSCRLDRNDFVVVEDLGPDIHGAVRRGKIYIARTTLDRGYRYIASTLYEEWLHRDHGKEDCTRELQTFLFEKLIAMVDRDQSTAPAPHPSIAKTVMATVAQLDEADMARQVAQ